MNNSYPSNHIANKWVTLLQVISQNPTIPSPTMWQLKKLMIHRLLMENILIFFFQYIGLSMNTSLTPLSFASGTACAFAFMRGSTILPGIFLGNFSYYLLKTPLFFSLAVASIYTLQAFFLPYLCQRFIQPTLVFFNIKKFFQCMIMISLITSLSTVTILYLTGEKIISLQTLSFYLSNINGIFIVAIALITWDMYFPAWHLLKTIKNKLFLAYGALFFIIIILVLSHRSSPTLLCSLLIFLLILTFSLVWGWCGTMSGVFLLGLLLNVAAYVGTPLFSISFNITIYLQFLLLAVTIIGLTISIYFFNHPD